MWRVRLAPAWPLQCLCARVCGSWLRARVARVRLRTQIRRRAAVASANAALVRREFRTPRPKRFPRAAVLEDMAFVRVSAVCCAWLACASPVVNVIAEPPASSQGSGGGASELEVASGQVAALAREVRAGERRVHERASGILKSQSAALRALRAPGAASFLALGDARADAGRLASLLADVAGSVGAAAPDTPLPGPDLHVSEAELDVRRLLVDAGEKFAAASGVGGRGKSTAAAFLQPVDANRLRSSLHVTEPMRSSPPMAVNVIMAEDVRGMQREAVYKGMAEQAAALTRDFETDLAALGSA